MVGTRSRGTPRAEASEVNGQAKKAVGAAPGTFSHTPTLLTLAWLIVSVSLVTWDTGYVLLRPLSMPGGSLHWPLWVPYDLYGRIDYIYGWKAFDERDGFTAAQSWLNVVESLMYAFYVITYFRKGVGDGKVKTLYGRPAAFALLVGYAAAVATLSKTALYCEF